MEEIQKSGFRCNICNGFTAAEIQADDLEGGKCSQCGSTMRLRSIILLLSRALFNLEIPLTEFPVLKSIAGMGMSDPELYAEPLSRCFSYTNTYYHQPPKLDITQPPATESGKYDFIISSEVLEHIDAPVERAFDSFFNLLKPTGFLILTVPYGPGSSTKEHFDLLQYSSLTKLNNKLVLVGQQLDGEYKVFDDLVFHGGTGATLEMRVFSEGHLRSQLENAGFQHLSFESDGSEEFGIRFSGLHSIPILASSQPRSFLPENVSELINTYLLQKKLLQGVRESRWVKIGRQLGIGPEIRKETIDS